MSNKYPAIFLMGPTAVGKSDFALKLAKKLPIEIISVDSAMVYRGMDIGTGKPSSEERRQVPHHLLDIRDPSEPYSAADFAKDALQKMSEITERGAIPVLVGGTFLYFRALQTGFSALPTADPVIRARLLAEAKVQGWAALHQRLASIDPKSAARIHPNDAQRIQRALEVYELCHKPMSELFGANPFNHPLSPDRERGLEEIYNVKSFALVPEDRAELHRRIEQRFYKMLEQGFLQEVTDFYQRGDLNSHMPSMRAVGYRQIWMYLEGQCSYEAMVLKAVAATRQLAKRQLTWLRSLSNITTLQNSGLGSFETVVHCVSERGV